MERETENPIDRDLGKVILHKRWGDKESLIPSSAETEAEEERTDNMSVDEDPNKIFFYLGDQGRPAK